MYIYIFHIYICMYIHLSVVKNLDDKNIDIYVGFSVLFILLDIYRFGIDKQNVRGSLYPFSRQRTVRQIRFTTRREYHRRVCVAICQFTPKTCEFTLSQEFTIRIPVGDKQEFVTVPSSTRVALQRWIDYTDLQRWSTSRTQPQPILLFAASGIVLTWDSSRKSSQGQLKESRASQVKRPRNDRCASHIKTRKIFRTILFLSSN